jgi:hypothetical protein
MANTPDYNWPPMEKRKVIGKPYKRLDGPQKASGRAKYCSDLKPKDMLFAVYLSSPHAHARVTSIALKRCDKQARDWLPSQIHGATAGSVEIPIHPDEGCARRQLTGRRISGLRETAVKMPGHEEPLSFRIAVREVAAGVWHAK